MTEKGRERFPRARHLSRHADVQRLYRAGRRRRLGHLEVWWANNQAGHPRMGLVVPKFQSTGVARNRLRRRLRELWRREIMPDLPPCDVLIRARAEAYGAGVAVLREELREWRAGME